MSAVALRLLGEMYAQGKLVRDREGREYAHWPWTLAALGIPGSSINKVRDQLLDMGLLVEHPGTLERGGRLYSTFSAPMAKPAERSALQEIVFPGGSAFSRREVALAEGSNLDRQEGAVESGRFESASSPREGALSWGATSQEEDAPGFEGPLAGTRANLEHHHQTAVTTTTNKHLPHRKTLPGERESNLQDGSSDVGESENTGVIAFNEGVVWNLALRGLQEAKVQRPEDVLRNHPLNSVLGALRQLVDKLRRGEDVQRPGGYVVHFLTTETYEPIAWDEDGLEFLTWFIESRRGEGKLIRFPGGRG